MESLISKKAEEIRKAKSAAKQEEEDVKNSEKQEKLSNLTMEFEEGFKEEIPLLKEAGIEYEACINPNSSLDKYIKFTLGTKTLKMDFSSKTSYRYECPPTTREGRWGNKQYGKWPKEDFILWIDDELIKKIVKPEQEIHDDELQINP